MKKVLNLSLAIYISIALIACNNQAKKQTTSDETKVEASIPGLGLTEKEVINSWVYIFSRYLVLRQEHIDIAEEGIDYNIIKYNELGKADFVSPNLDVAYMECWLAVDESTPVILEIPKIEGRYYTAQICDQWGEILHNINERNFPNHPYGKYAICLKGSNPEIPEGALRIDIPAKKAKMLARVERQGDDEGAIALQQAFKIIKVGEPKIDAAVEVPMFTNKEPITVDAFSKPMVEKVLASSIDLLPNADAFQKKVMEIADFVSKSEDNKNLIDKILKEKAFPQLINRIKNYGVKKGGWSAVGEEVRYGFKDDYWQRAIVDYFGLWANASSEAMYYVGEKDSNGDELIGDNIYLIHYKKEALPMDQVNGYWSLTLFSKPDYRVVPNKLNRYNLNNISKLEYEEDGSLKLYLASELPEGAPEANWLPTPKGKSFSLNHRYYAPKEDAITYKYYAPPIQKINN